MTALKALVHLWKDWGIQVLVVLSFALQVILLILAEVRRRIDSGVLRAAVWSAYLLADSTAIYALGHLSVTSGSPEHQLMALWAPFLLVHLGGQDNITAYAIEDNRLWLRHLQLLAVQVAAAAYVLYESSIVGSQTLLWRAAMMMFVVGVVKYGERVWALKCASADESSKNYPENRKLEPCYENIDMGSQDTEDLLRKAHLMLNGAKTFFHRPLKGREIRYVWVDCPEAHKNLFTLVEMQLYLMHDVLYSKAEVIRTWYGLCIRTISSVCTAVAFVLFHRSGQSDHRHGYSRADVSITYVLLAGAVVLEATSLLRVMSSSWVWADLKFLGPLVSPLRRLVLPERRRWWSESVGQHNIFELYDRRKNSRSSRIARWAGKEDWWNTMVHSRRIPVSQKMKQLLLEMFKIPEGNTLSYLEWHSAGDAIYKAMGFYPNSGVHMRLDESIVVWHIATEVYLRWYKDHQEQSNDRSEDEEQAKELVEAIEALSNYMLFLLVARTYMLPDPNRFPYNWLCIELGVTSNISTENFVRSLQAYGSARNKGISHDQLFDKFDLPALCFWLAAGSRLGAKLIGEGLAGTPADDRANQIAQELGISAADSHELEGNEFGADRLKLIAFAWARILFDVGECGDFYHCRQLSNGGELLTVAGLMGYHVRRNQELHKQRARQSGGGTSIADV